MSADPKNSWKRDLLAELRNPANQSWEADPPPDPFAQSNSSTRSVLDTIRSPNREKRGRAWEKRNRAFSYIIPAPLHSAAAQLRGDLLSIAQFDPDGKPREDLATVDDVARILMDWVLDELNLSPNLLTLLPNPRSRKGQMTVAREAWDGWDKTPISLKQPVRRSRKPGHAKKCVLSFRWGPEIDARIKAIAGISPGSQSNNNPHKFAVPLGDLVVTLLGLAVIGYRTHQYQLIFGHKTTPRADGWSRS